MSGQYRPSGPLRWVIDRLSSHSPWDLIGTVAAEPRANEVARQLCMTGKLGRCSFIDIEDEPSEFQTATKAAREFHRQALSSLLGGSPKIVQMDLFSEIDDLDDMFAEIESTIGKNVILDITSFPKRFFFFLVRRLSETDSVKNLVVTYAIPESYGTTLHKNPGGWMPLPSFGIQNSTRERPMLVVAVGYHHLKLLDVIRERMPSPVRLLMPFPSMPPGFAQNWEFVRYLREQVEFNQQDIRRVDPFSVSLAFDHLEAQCAAHHGELLLAPFGPKPMSLAMALYALSRENAGDPVSVGYTQPMAYSDQYSQGVKKAAGGAVIHAYCIKLNGEKLYAQ